MFGSHNATCDELERELRPRLESQQPRPLLLHRKTEKQLSLFLTIMETVFIQVPRHIEYAEWNLISKNVGCKRLKHYFRSLQCRVDHI